MHIQKLGSISSNSTCFWNKVLHLNTLIQNGIQVPQGYAISYDAFQYFRNHGKLHPELIIFFSEIQSISLGSHLFALRSSASIEDSNLQSYAWYFDSKLNISPHELESALIEIFKCANKKLWESDFQLWIILQEMILWEKSWVAFSHDPITGTESPIIEAVYWLCENLVNGTSTPEQYTTETISEGDAILSHQEREDLLTTLAQIQGIFHWAVDIEWTIHKEQLYILQARAITTIPKKELAEILESHISLTEWYQQLWIKNTEKLSQEDNSKRKRLSELNRFIEIPFDTPVSFELQDIVNNDAAFQNYLTNHDDNLCALRLIPKNSKDTKKRIRGLTVREAVEDWLPKQNLIPEKYTADIVPHSDNVLWSCIFVVTETKIYGEILKGSHHLLTQALTEKNQTHIHFEYDFQKITLSEDNPEAKQHIQDFIQYIHIKNSETQKQIQDNFDAKFTGDYLQGYFETVMTQEYGIWFIDWNRELIQDINLSLETDFNIASPWDAREIEKTLCNNIELCSKKDIFICDSLHPKYIRYLQTIWGVISNKWGILSHAAIVCRELGIPYIIMPDLDLDASNGKIIYIDLLAWRYSIQA